MYKSGEFEYFNFNFKFGGNTRTTTKPSRVKYGRRVRGGPTLPRGLWNRDGVVSFRHGILDIKRGLDLHEGQPSESLLKTAAMLDRQESPSVFRLRTTVVVNYGIRRKAAPSFA